MLKHASMQYKPTQVHHLLSLLGEDAVPLHRLHLLSHREGPRVQAVLAPLY